MSEEDFKWDDDFKGTFNAKVGGRNFSRSWEKPVEYVVALKSNAHPAMQRIIVQVLDPKDRTQNFGIALGMPTAELEEKYRSSGKDFVKASEDAQWYIGGKHQSVQRFNASL